MDHNKEEPGHHILTVKTIVVVGICLFIFTWLTVHVAGYDFGAMNFPVAMLIASIKASLVALFFMALKYDAVENRVIFVTSLVFGAIFIILTSVDIFFRADDVYVTGPIFKEAKAASKFKQPWVKSNELLTHGKKVFSGQCVACHGSQGAGDGPAAASLNPKPRDFTVAADWIKKRQPSQVYEVLTNGVGKMPAFGNLPLDDRWALTHYVLSLGPKPIKDSDSDLKKVGIDTSKPDGGIGTSGPTELPIDFAIELMAVDGSVKQ